MKKTPAFILVVLLFTAASAQAQPVLTTVILLRHAEKENDGTRDPELSVAGKQRAQSLVQLLEKTKIDAIYSTNFKRTRGTVVPLASARNLTIMDYEPAKLEEVMALIQKFRGGTIVVCGHSNTTPSLINFLTGHKDEYKTFDDADYGNLVITTFAEAGKDTKVTWLRY